MDDKTRFRVVIAAFALMTLAGSLELIAFGGTALSMIGGVTFWSIACSLTGFAVYRAIARIESRRLHI